MKNALIILVMAFIALKTTAQKAEAKKYVYSSEQRMTINTLKNDSTSKKAADTPLVWKPNMTELDSNVFIASLIIDNPKKYGCLAMLITQPTLDIIKPVLGLDDSFYTKKLGTTVVIEQTKLVCSDTDKIIVSKREYDSLRRRSLAVVKNFLSLNDTNGIEYIKAFLKSVQCDTDDETKPISWRALYVQPHVWSDPIEVDERTLHTFIANDATVRILVTYKNGDTETYSGLSNDNLLKLKKRSLKPGSTLQWMLETNDKPIGSNPNENDDDYIVIREPEKPKYDGTLVIVAKETHEHIIEQLDEMKKKNARPSQNVFH